MKITETALGQKPLEVLVYDSNIGVSGSLQQKGFLARYEDLNAHYDFTASKDEAIEKARTNDYDAFLVELKWGPDVEAEIYATAELMSALHRFPWLDTPVRLIHSHREPFETSMRIEDDRNFIGGLRQLHESYGYDLEGHRDPVYREKLLKIGKLLRSPRKTEAEHAASTYRATGWVEKITNKDQMWDALVGPLPKKISECGAQWLQRVGDRWDQIHEESRTSNLMAAHYYRFTDEFYRTNVDFGFGRDFTEQCVGKIGLVAETSLEEFGKYLKRYSRKFDDAGMAEVVYERLHKQFPKHFLNWNFE